MKLRVEIDGAEHLLELERTGVPGELRYTLTGSTPRTGIASVTEGAPGVFSVLLGNKSLTVGISAGTEELTAAVGHRNHRITLADARDRSAKLKNQAVAGPVELRAQMPGKVIKMLAAPGDAVTAGQSLIVVEAMKMQNEVKAPKDAVVGKIFVAEGATVAAGEALIRLE